METSGNENPVVRPVPPASENGHNGQEHLPPEMKAAKDLARRYRLPFVDLLPPDRESPIDYELFTEVPVDLMVRHQFVPLKRDQKGLHIAMADPTDLERLDELSSTLQLRARWKLFCEKATRLSACCRKLRRAFVFRLSKKLSMAKKCSISID